MSDKAGAKRYLIRGGRIYDHDGDVHQPAVADLLINGETIERIAVRRSRRRTASRSSRRRESSSFPD